MRRFIVEVVLDALILLVIILVLGIICVAQPFPFGPDSAPILALRGAGLDRLPVVGGRPRPRQPVRPARSSSRSPAGCCSRRWASSS